MATADEMRISLEDARFFREQIDRIVRGPQQQHDLTVIRRYFRAYLHCWKTVLHFVRVAKHLDGRKNNRAWIAWCKRWLARLDPAEIEVFEQLRETRDYGYTSRDDRGRRLTSRWSGPLARIRSPRPLTARVCAVHAVMLGGASPLSRCAWSRRTREAPGRSREGASEGRVERRCGASNCLSCQELGHNFVAMACDV
jgi:hypothetical protein